MSVCQSIIRCQHAAHNMMRGFELRSTSGLGRLKITRLGDLGLRIYTKRFYRNRCKTTHTKLLKLSPSGLAAQAW